MNLNPPKKSTFYISLIAAAVGLIAYLLGHFNLVAAAWLGLLGFILVIAAFIFLSLGLTVKGL